MELRSENCVEKFMENTGLDIDDVSELYALFLVELYGEVESLNSYLTSNDFQNAQKVVHNIKGISSNYMTMDIFNISNQISLQIKSGAMDNIDLKITEMFEEVQTIKRAITSFFNSRGIELEV